MRIIGIIFGIILMVIGGYCMIKAEYNINHEKGSGNGALLISGFSIFSIGFALTCFNFFVAV